MAVKPAQANNDKLLWAKLAIGTFLCDAKFSKFSILEYYVILYDVNKSAV